MADAVHFLTYDDQATPANASGCNGFSFPYDYTTPASDAYPVTTSYRDAIKWYWRVKKWTLVSNLTIDGDLFTGGVATDSGVTRELDLIFPVSKDNTLASGDFGFNLHFYPSVNFDGSDYRPGLFVAGSYVTITFNTAPSALPGIPDGSFTINIDGQSTLMHYTNPSTLTITCTQFDFTPSEFWPYAAVDSSPIYNTTTGAQLQDPRN